MTAPVERAKMDWGPWLIDVLGLPQLDEVLPAPADMLDRWGFKKPRDVIVPIREKIIADLDRFRPRRF